MRQITTPLITGSFSDDKPPVETTMEIHACYVGQGKQVHLALVPLRDGQRLSVNQAVCFKGKKPMDPSVPNSLHILPDDTYEITCSHCKAKLNDLLNQRVRYLEQQNATKTIQERFLEILKEQPDYIVLGGQAGVPNNA